MHLVLLGAAIYVFRQPFSTTITLAGPGEGNGEGVIEVGVVEAGRLGLTTPRAVSYVGVEENKVNNEVVETKTPETASDAEVLPSETKPVKPKEKLVTTDRPTAKQNEQLITEKPMRGSSTNTNVEVGRSFGSQVPSMNSGVGVGAGGNLGPSGVPGGSEYGRRIQLILSRNYNPPASSDPGAPQYVIVQLRISRDGQILSLVGGRLSSSYIKKRSTNDLVNYAAERAIIASNPLPSFPNGFLLGAQEALAEIWFRYPK